MSLHILADEVAKERVVFLSIGSSILMIRLRRHTIHHRYGQYLFYVENGDEEELVCVSLQNL